MHSYDIQINSETFQVKAGECLPKAVFYIRSLDAGWSEDGEAARISVTPIFLPGRQYYNEVVLLIDEMEVLAPRLQSGVFGWELLDIFASRLKAETRGATVCISASLHAQDFLDSGNWRPLDGIFAASKESQDILAGKKMRRLLFYLGGSTARPLLGFYSLDRARMQTEAREAQFVTATPMGLERTGDSLLNPHTFESEFSTAGERISVPWLSVFLSAWGSDRANFEIVYNPCTDSDEYKKLRSCGNYAQAIAEAVKAVARFYANPLSQVTFYSADHEAMMAVQEEGWELLASMSLKKPAENISLDKPAED